MGFTVALDFGVGCCGVGRLLGFWGLKGQDQAAVWRAGGGGSVRMDRDRIGRGDVTGGRCKVRVLTASLTCDLLTLFASDSRYMN